MTARREIGAALAVSLGVHAAAFGAWPDGGGAGAGDGGAGEVTLAALPGMLAPLVAEWDRPPDVRAAPAARQSEPRPDAGPGPAPVADAAVGMPEPPRPHAPPAADGPPLAMPDRPAAVPVPSMLAAAPDRGAAPDAVPTASLRAAPDPLRMAARAPSPPGSAQPERPPEPDAMAPAAPSGLAPAVSVVPAPRPRAPGSAAQPPRPAEVARGQPLRVEAAPAARSAAASAGPGDGARTRLIGEWGAHIRASIERQKRFPRGVRAGGQVDLRIVVGIDGVLSTVTVTRSSGIEALDRAAVDAVRRARLPRAPKDLAAQPYSFNLPMAFAL